MDEFLLKYFVVTLESHLVHFWAGDAIFVYPLEHRKFNYLEAVAEVPELDIPPP